MSDVTRILSQIDQGDPQAAEKLLPLVYDELGKLAAVILSFVATIATERVIVHKGLQSCNHRGPRDSLELLRDQLCRCER